MDLFPSFPSLLHVFCFCSVLDFFLQNRLVLFSSPLLLVPAARLSTGTRRQQLHVFGAARARGSRNPGERLLVWRGQVDHEEHAVRRILLRADAGQLVLPPAASDGGQQLTVPLGVLKVLQGDHVGEAQLAVEAETSSAAPHEEGEDAEEEQEEGGGRYADVGDGSCVNDGLA